MADNETNIGNPSVDVDIIPKVVAIEQSMAQVVRSFAELKPVIYARVAIDREVTGGVGEQVQRAVDEATKHLQFAFSGLLKSNTDIRTLEDSLRSMMTVSEEAGQKLQAVFTAGARGGPQFKISTAQDVGPALEAMQRHRADFPAEQMRLRVGGSALDQARYGGAARAFSGITEPAVDKELQREREATIKATAAAAKVEADLARARLNTIAKEQEEHTKAQGSFGAGWDKAALAEKQQLFREEKIEADINIRQKLAEVAASKALVEAKRNELNLAQRVGAGQPLRRAIAPAITEGLGGSDAAAITGGIMAMVMQSMIFRIGWGAMGLAEQGVMAGLALPGALQKSYGEYEQETIKRKWAVPYEGKEQRESEVTGANAVIYRTLHDVGLGIPEVQTQMGALAEIEKDYGKAVTMTTALGAIALGQSHSAKERAGMMTQLQTGYAATEEKGGESKIPEFVLNPQNVLIKQELFDFWKQAHPSAYTTPDEQDPEFQTWVKSGKVGRELLGDAIRNAAIKHYEALEAAQASGSEKNYIGQEHGSAFFTENAADEEAFLRRHGIQNPKVHSYQSWFNRPRSSPDQPVTGAYTPAQGKYIYIPRESIPGMGGEPTPLDISEERKNVKGHYYQFSSITGLAEQMQMMASGGGIPEQQLSEAQKTNTTLTEMNNKMGQGGAQHAPLGRQLSISHGASGSW